MIGNKSIHFPFEVQGRMRREVKGPQRSALSARARRTCQSGMDEGSCLAAQREAHPLN